MAQMQVSCVPDWCRALVDASRTGIKAGQDRQRALNLVSGHARG